jgi:hypothetical protein
MPLVLSWALRNIFSVNLLTTASSPALALSTGPEI